MDKVSKKSTKNNSKSANFTEDDLGIPDYSHIFDQTEKIKDQKKSKFLGAILKKHKGSLILSTFIYFLMAIPTYILPIITAKIIDIATIAVESGFTTELKNTLIVYSVILFFAILSNVPTTKWRWNITSKMLRSISAGIRSSLVKKLQRLSITYHKQMLTGKIQSKFIKDTETLDGALGTLINAIVPALLGLVVAVVICLVNSPVISLFFLVVVPLNVGLTFLFNKKIKTGYHNYRVNTEIMSAKMTTMLEMVPVTKSHGLEQVEIDSVDKSIKSVAGAGMRVDKTVANFGAWLFVLHVMLNSLVLVICALLAINGKISVGEIVLFQSMFSQLSNSVNTLVGTLPQIGSGVEAARSLSEIMNATDVEDLYTGEKTEIEGNVEFKNVSYRYPDGDTLVVNDFSLNIKKGECIAVVGSSGSGKSTIMNMIIGFLKPTDGDILIDGKSINDYNLSSYRHNLSVVPQNSILFEGTIRENITYGLSCYTEEQLNKVVEMANISEFLPTLSNGLDTRIGEHGDKLSGGQKQRITIARALIRNPKILILDEATSALDNISEYHVQQAIASSIKGRTTFIVAHRLSTIRDADRIVVMENGKCVEIGTYSELMKKKGKFFELKNLNDLNSKKAEQALS